MKNVNGAVATFLAFSGLVVTVAYCYAFTPAIPALANGPAEVQVTLNAPDEVSPDSNFTVTVDISQVENFDAANYDVSFDNTVLRLDNVTSGEIGSTTIPVDIWNEIGSGTYVIVQNVPGLAGVTGSGYLATWHFHVIGSQTQSTTISLSNGALSNKLAQAIPATWNGDSFNVISDEPDGGGSPASPPPPTTTTPSPTPTPPTQSPHPFVTSGSNISDVVDTSGAFTQDVIVEAVEGKIELAIVKDTVGLTKEDGHISEIRVSEVAEPPAPPSDHSIVGSVYDIGPDKATFDQPVTITLSYTLDEIPHGVSEESMVIAYRYTDTKEWIILEDSIVDREHNTVTASTSHFTLFTIIAQIPPSFHVTDFTVSPLEVKIGENVTVSALVENTGDSDGSYEITLKINGEMKATQRIDLAAGQSGRFSSNISKSVPGSYTVTINGFTDTFTVKAPPPKLATMSPPPTPPAKPTPSAPPTEPAPSLSPAELTSPPPTEPAPEAAEPQPAAVNWPVLWGVIGGVVIVVGLLTYFRFRSRY